MTTGIRRREIFYCLLRLYQAKYLPSDKVLQVLLSGRREKVVPEKMSSDSNHCPYESQQIGGLFAERMKSQCGSSG